MSKAQQDIRRKRQVLEYAQQIGNVRKACRYFGIGRAGFYRWRGAFEREGAAGLVNKRPIARSHPKATRPEIVDQVLHLRRTYYLGPIRIMVTDIQVPGMRGPELAERIASLRPGIKVLFTSGGLAVHENLPAKAALLDKPFSIEALARKVRQLLDS